jgi:hypothetical protein
MMREVGHDDPGEAGHDGSLAGAWGGVKAIRYSVPGIPVVTP